MGETFVPITCLSLVLLLIDDLQGIQELKKIPK